MASIDALRVAYLAGTSFCGSTLMALLMDSHPQIASVGETNLNQMSLDARSQYTCSCGEVLHNCSFWRQVFEGVNGSGYTLNVDQWTTDYNYKHPLLQKALTSYSPYSAVRAFQRAAALILPIHRSHVKRVNRVNVAFIQSVLDVHGAEVFFDASKRLRRLEQLLRIPELEVRVVRMVRDVRAYVDSARRNYKRPIEKSAKRWKHTQINAEALTRALPPESVLLLKYEDLCREPKQWMQTLYRFLDVEVVEPPDTIFAHEHHVIGNRTRLNQAMTIRFDEKWRETLTNQEALRTLRIAGEINASIASTIRRRSNDERNQSSPE